MQAKKQTARHLPTPDPASASHSSRVSAYLREQIHASGGSIGFGDFMHTALYAPGLGYYVAGANKFGRGGDFTTAPEISPLFGYVLARQIAPVLEDLRTRQTGQACVLEFGAGSGALAISVLERLQTLDALPERYLILDVSEELRLRQQRNIDEALGPLAKRVEWLHELPEKFDGAMIANEVVDALPFERFRVTNDNVEQARVAVSNDAFCWHYEPANDGLRNGVRHLENEMGVPFAGGFESELCLAARPWLTDVLAALRRGSAFIIDYGTSRREYYASERRRGFLRCHFQQHAHDDPLLYPGIQDITTWVDFTALAEAAVASGASVDGYLTQSEMLIAGGIEAELNEFSSLPVSRQLQLSAQVKLLTLPAEMGENFKCLLLRKGDGEPPPVAVLARNRLHTL